MNISAETLKRVISFGHELDRDAELPNIEKVAGLYPRGFLSLFAAQAGTGKTWFMQYIACRLSCGGNILAGLVPKSRKMKTVIFAGETGKFLLEKRLQATCWAYDKKRIKVYDAVELQREEIPIMLNTEEGRATTLAIMEHEKPDIIFYDTLISFHTADESKQGEMTSIYTFLLKLARAFDCAVVLNHHTRKRSTKAPTAKLTQDDIIGSNSGVRLASCAYIAEQVHEDATVSDRGMPTVKIANVKNWDKRLPVFQYKFITDEATNRLDFAIDWSADSSIDEQWSIHERIQAYIDSMDAGAMITAEAVCSATQCSDDRARYYLDQFTKKGMLERVKFMNATAWKVTNNV